MRFYLKIKNLSSKVKNDQYLGGYSQLFKYISGPCKDCMLNVKITSDDYSYSEWLFRAGYPPPPLRYAVIAIHIRWNCFSLIKSFKVAQTRGFLFYSIGSYVLYSRRDLILLENNNIWYNSWAKCNDQIIVTASEVHGFQMDYTTYKLLYVDFNLWIWIMFLFL